jgi:hypothetical protein
MFTACNSQLGGMLAPCYVFCAGRNLRRDLPTCFHAASESSDNTQHTTHNTQEQEQEQERPMTNMNMHLNAKKGEKRARASLSCLVPTACLVPVPTACLVPTAVLRTTSK